MSRCVKLLSGVIVVLGCIGIVDASYLLSGNMVNQQDPGTDEFPSDTPVIATGATYSWEQGSDSQLINNDNGGNYPDMTDGVKFQGEAETDCTWSAGFVWGAVIFDLKDTYIVEKVWVRSREWKNENPVRHGISRMKVYLSDDGSNFTLVGTVERENQELVWSADWTDTVAYQFTLDGINQQTRYVKIRIEKDSVGDSCTLYQMVPTEMAVWGSQVPEPTTLGLISLGLGLLSRRSR